MSPVSRTRAKSSAIVVSGAMTRSTEEWDMAVARDDLRRDRLRVEPELRRDVFLDPRIDVGEGADGAGYRAGRHFLARGEEASVVAGKLGVMPGELQSEGRRLGMDAV